MNEKEKQNIIETLFRERHVLTLKLEAATQLLYTEINKKEFVYSLSEVERLIEKIAFIVIEDKREGEKVTKKGYVLMENENVLERSCAGKLTQFELLIHKCNDLLSENKELTLRLEAATSVLYKLKNNWPSVQFLMDEVETLIQNEIVKLTERRDERS